MGSHLEVYNVLLLFVGIFSGAYFFSNAGWLGVLSSSIVILSIVIFIEVLLGALE
jgi:hypothetical protein